jgi:hypothetical protein
MMRLAMMSTTESQKSGKASSDHSSLILANMRLVTSLGRTRQMLSTYMTLLEAPFPATVTLNSKIAAVAFFTEFSKFAAFALAFWYGSVVVDQTYCNFAEMFASLNGVLFCGILTGIYASMLPKKSDALEGAAHTRALMDSLHVSFLVC